MEGYDACRKIAILSSLAFGRQVDYEDIYTEGISKITATDIKYAKAMGQMIKLLAVSRKVDGSFYAMVSPVLVGPSDPLYSVNGVFNAIFVHGNVLGDAMFYGSGAGKLPTASAVVADVVDEARHLNRSIMALEQQKTGTDRHQQFQPQILCTCQRHSGNRTCKSAGSIRKRTAGCCGRCRRRIRIRDRRDDRGRIQSKSRKLW